jgi:hypothetical protein
MAGLFTWRLDFLIREKSERKGLMYPSYTPSTEEQVLVKTSSNETSASALFDTISLSTRELLFLTAHRDQKNKTMIKYMIILAIM